MLELLALVVINEVRYDPPGADAGGEYIELLNTSADAVVLDGTWSLERGNGSRPGDWAHVWRGDGTSLRAGERLVVGDDPRSDRSAVLALQNGPDGCRLVRSNVAVDVVGWGAHTYSEYAEGEPAPDPSSGHIARWPDGVDTDRNAGDFREATIETPGFSNSPARWLSLDPAWPPTAPAHVSSGVSAALRVDVTNAGADELPAGRCGIDVTAGHERIVRWAFSTSLPPGASRSVHVALPSFSSEDVCLRAVPWHAAETIGGEPVDVPLVVGYRGVGLNEVMAEPVGGEPEWFEVWGEPTSSLAGWSVRDASGGAASLTGDFVAGSHIVFTSDRGALLNVRDVDGDRVVELSGWPSLNNDGETLALVDDRGAVRDAVAFDARPGESLERVHRDVAADDPAAFVFTADPTPGAPNRARATLPVTSVFEITPPVLADEPVHVRFHFGDGGGDVRLLLADSRGILRGELYRNREGGSRGVFVWSGELNGKRVRPGLYVVVAEYESDRGERHRRRAPLAVSWSSR